jgi:hypothetical protein
LIHLITGIWFQVRSGLSIAFDRTGAVPVWQTAMCHFMFTGGFGPSHNDRNILTGNMTDPAGESELSDIKLTETELSFTKKYVHREDFIEYTFRKQPDGTWKGTYSGSACGTGQSHCVLAQVGDDFLAMD